MSSVNYSPPPPPHQGLIEHIIWFTCLRVVFAQHWISWISTLYILKVKTCYHFTHVLPYSSYMSRRMSVEHQVSYFNYLFMCSLPLTPSLSSTHTAQLEGRRPGLIIIVTLLPAKNLKQFLGKCWIKLKHSKTFQKFSSLFWQSCLNSPESKVVCLLTV